jgi:glycosyltransferase involved in cell wall biosynthesis
MSDTIGVSVCIFTYNYASFLSQALESVLAQQTSFAVEIVIGDDCSTDNTRAIARDYAEKYPDRFVLSFNETNIGGTHNWIRTMNKCRGRYIALLDGDDYFTDVLKLQKQYDSLEANKEFVLSFHSVEEKYDDISGLDKIVSFEKEVYTIGDFLARGWFVRTGSTFFRNGIAPVDPPQWVYDFPYRYDTILHVFLCMHGKAIFLPDVMSVWRKHSKGMSKTLNANMIKNLQTEIALSGALDRHTGFRYSSKVRVHTARCYSILFFHILRSNDRRKYLPVLMRCLLYMDYGRSFGVVKRKLIGNTFPAVQRT